MALRLTDITVDQLRRWEIPMLEETGAYWAFHRSPGTLPVLCLPQHPVPGGLPQGWLTIYIDPGEGWLWAKVPTNPRNWMTPEQARTHPQPDEADVLPGWIRATGRNYPFPGQDGRDPRPPLLVRRRISADEAQAVLDEIMPPAAEYPLDESLAAIVRLGGWSPSDLRLLWWSVTTPEDAHALAAHLPYWWKIRQWGEFFLAPDAPPSLPARALGELTERGVRPDVADRCIWYGITDVDRIAALRPPAIPDDATRITYPGMRNPVVDVDPGAARDALERDPERWLRTIDVTAGVRPLHIQIDRHHNQGPHFAVWSDGRITDGIVNPPASLPDGETARDWRLRHRDFEATHHLLLSILTAQNRTDLGSDLWMPWRGAARAEGGVVSTASTDRAIGADRTARRILTLTLHTIHHDDGVARHVWQLAETVTITTSIPGRPEHTALHSEWHTVHSAAAAAEQAFVDAATELPPLETVEEIAARAGTTRDAIAQAISRGRKARLKRNTKHPRDLDRTRPDPGPPDHETIGRATWYDPRAFLAWLDSRPGHGPGRGHTTR